MTHDQKEHLKNMIFAAQRVVQLSQYARLAYPLAESIVRLDDLQSACYQFVEQLPAESESASEK